MSRGRPFPIQPCSTFCTIALSKSLLLPYVTAQCQNHDLSAKKHAVQPQPRSAYQTRSVGWLGGWVVGTISRQQAFLVLAHILVPHREARPLVPISGAQCCCLAVWRLRVCDNSMALCRKQRALGTAVLILLSEALGLEPLSVLALS